MEPTKEKYPKSVMEAIMKLQQECPPILQESSAGEGRFKYTYASLGQIIKAIKPLMASNNLMFSQIIEGQTINTIVMEVKTGEYIKSTVNIPEDVSLRGMNQYQSLGAAITYLKRYALGSILGLVAEEDNDAAGEQVSPAATPNRTPTSAQPQSPDTWIEIGDKAWNRALEKGMSVAQIREYYKMSKANATEYERQLEAKKTTQAPAAKPATKTESEMRDEKYVDDLIKKEDAKKSTPKTK